MPSFYEALGQTWPARLAKDAYAALMLPGDVYQGKVSMYGEDGRTNPEVINRAADLGGLVMGGSYAAAPAMRNGVGMGVRAYQSAAPEYVRNAAIRVGEDIFEAPQHWEAMAKAGKHRGMTSEQVLGDLGDYDAFYAPNNQNFGFTTSHGRFITREEADKIVNGMTEQQYQAATDYRRGVKASDGPISLSDILGK